MGIWNLGGIWKNLSPCPSPMRRGGSFVPPSLPGKGARGLGLQLIDEDAAAEDAHHFARILGWLGLAPFADFGVAETIEGVNRVSDALGRTDD